MEHIVIPHEQVLQLLPHRRSALLLDEISELAPGRYAVGKYLVDYELDVLKGHFAGDPTLPGVYSVEVVNQVADILIGATPEFKDNPYAFLGVNRSRFYKRVRPGDQLVIRDEITAQEESVLTLLGRVYCNDELAVEVEVVFALNGLQPATHGAVAPLPEEVLSGGEKRHLSNQDILNYTRIRDPYRLLDEITEMVSAKYAIGEFYVNPAMAMPGNYRPDAPVLPSFYLIETTEQTGGIMVASSTEFAGKRSLLLGINRARVYRMVYPGETIRTYSHIANIRMDKFIITYVNQADVGDELAAETEIAIAMR